VNDKLVVASLLLEHAKKPVPMRALAYTLSVSVEVCGGSGLVSIAPKLVCCTGNGIAFARQRLGVDGSNLPG